MKIVLAPNALKGSLTAEAAAQAMADGVRDLIADAQLVSVPIADGGDGLLDVLAPRLGAQIHQVPVRGPLGEPMQAHFGYIEDSAVAIIEMARASGLALLADDERNPEKTTTQGTGDLIKAALDLGAEKIILGIGGSATNDGGIGMAEALGVRFLDENGQSLEPVGGNLGRIASIDSDEMDARCANLHVQVICDVDNPLLGQSGATAVYGPQKGADDDMQVRLEEGLAGLYQKLEGQYQRTLMAVPGAGAAGGLGAGLLCFLDAELCRGIDVVFELTGLDAALDGADLVFTCEGQLDAQSAHGKAPVGVAERAAERDIACIALAGSVDGDAAALASLGFSACLSLCSGPASLEFSMAHAADLLRSATYRALQLYCSGEQAGRRRLDEKSDERNSMIKKCLFPAAGYGTRFLPATKAMPKEVMPIVDKPIVQYGVEEALNAGMDQIAFITGRGKRALEDHFDISYELEHQISGTSKESKLDSIRRLIDTCTFSYTRQVEMKGLGHAILTGETLIGSEAFGVILADDLCVGESDDVMTQMVRLYEKYRCSIVAIEEVPMDEVYKYGVIKGRELDSGIYMIDDMVEKPPVEEAPSNLAIIGRYILTPDIFDIIRDTPPGKNGEVQITDALLTQAKQGMVLAYKFKGQRFDCGSVDGFVAATNHFYEKMKEEGAV